MSIRDQMFRGYIIVKRALAKGLLERYQELPILVIGGGVAGVIASLTAIQNNVPVTLVEKSQFLGVQEFADHRIVCPTQYDWPASHWDRRVYPWRGAPMPLSWYREAASKVAAAWRSQLPLRAKRSKLLSLKRETEFRSHSVDAASQTVSAELKSKLGVVYTAGPFSIAIACGGAGIERTIVPDAPNQKYTGYQFWKADPYDDNKNLGLDADKHPSVLISGGGDGSLQDYLRVVCHMPAGEIYSELPDDIKDYAEQEVAKIEDVAMRCYLWGDTGKLDHPIHEEVQEQYQDLVNYLLTKHAAAVDVNSKLEALVQDRIHNLKLKFIYPCNHFWSCYPLNRFLVLLLSEFLRRKGIETLGPDTRLLDVTGINHSCNNVPPDCHGQDHEVTVADANCDDYRTSTRNMRTLSGGPFNILIIRHGIERYGFPLGNGPAANPYRQIMPYTSVW